MNKIETKEEKADRLKKQSRRLETLMFISLANPPPEIERAIISWKRRNENFSKGFAET